MILLLTLIRYLKIRQLDYMADPYDNEMSFPMTLTCLEIKVQMNKARDSMVEAITKPKIEVIIAKI